METKLLPNISSFWTLSTVFASLIFLSACADEDFTPSEAFSKIYDDSDAAINYRPIDIVETNDGYIILAGTELDKTDFRGIQLIKVDEQGEFEFQQEIPDYVVPVGNMFMTDSISYFFAMTAPPALEAVLIGVDTQLQIVLEERVSEDEFEINYPLSAAPLANGNLLLQSYDNDAQVTQLSEITLNGVLTSNRVSYSIGPGEDVEEDVIDHFLDVRERPFPFFCGQDATGNFYFNGFFNSSFSLVFTNFGDNPIGVVQGQDADAGIRALLPQTGANFSVAGFQFDENFQLANTALATTSITSSVDLFPGNMAEIKPYPNAKIIPYTTETANATIFATETKSGQILLTFYDEAGEITDTHRIGFLNPFTLANIRVGSDNSLLVLGTSFVAGRFERITFNKFSAGDIGDFIE